MATRSSRRLAAEPPAELHNVEHVPRAEALQQLPRDYSGIVEPKSADETRAVPELGPPLPGDLGRPILNAEMRGPQPGSSFVPSASASVARVDPEELARAQQLNERREAEDAARSALFFRSGVRAKTTPVASGDGVVPASDVLIARVQQPASPSTDATPAAQDRLEKFLNAGSDTATRSPHSLRDPVSTDVIMAGTVIPAALLTGINPTCQGK